MEEDELALGGDVALAGEDVAEGLARLEEGEHLGQRVGGGSEVGMKGGMTTWA